MTHTNVKEMCVKDFISFIKEGMSMMLITSSKRIQKPAITCIATPTVVLSVDKSHQHHYQQY